MERKVKSEVWKNIWTRYKYVILVVLIGVILLLLPVGKKAKTAAQPTAAVSDETQQSLTDTEARMEAILSKISGVGELQLMLTAEAGSEQELAQNTELSYSGDTSSPDTYSRKSETVIVSGGSEDAPVVTRTVCPVYRGALVVCQGGGNPEVKLAVTQAVAALTGLSSDRITVVRCQ